MISSVHVTKSAETVDLVTFTEKILDGKFYFLYGEILISELTSVLKVKSYNMRN